FFSDEEIPTLSAFCDTVTAQDSDPRVPVLALVDKKLHEGKLDGFQYEDMPDDREVWRIVARGLDQEAMRVALAAFASASSGGAPRRSACAATATTRRWTSRSSAAARAAGRWPSGSRGAAGGWWRSSGDRSGTPTATGSPTRRAPTSCSGPTSGSSGARTRSS